MGLILPGDFGSTPRPELTLPKGFTGLLLHCCCAPCAGAVLECLKVNRIRPLVFFYNPNIMPKEEYEKRRGELTALCELLDFPCVTGDYNVNEFLAMVKGHEHDPERGQRCLICFTHRLEVSARFGKKRGLSHFATTLASSRWKSKKMIDDAANAAAEKVGGIQYWNEDWRKGGMIVRRNELVKSFSFYNQDYCGCIYSREYKDRKTSGAKRT